jgi:hypothetical protein
MSANRKLSSLKYENNCSKLNQNKFVLDTKTKLIDDVCYESGENKQNTNINDYMLSNYASCECNLDNVLKTSLDNQGIIVKDGYGISECNINNDSVLRQGIVKRHNKLDQQLFPRPYLTTPSVARGKAKPNLESKLLNSQMVKRHGQMQYYDQGRVYTPLVPNLQRNIQNPNNIIQDHVTCNWVRGGISSRDSVKYSDYMNRSTDSDVVKNLLQKKMGCLYN